MQLTSCLQFVLVLALSGLSLTGCTAENDAGASASATVLADDKTPIQAPHATLKVYGMACPLCASNIDKNLAAMPGVSNVKVDMGKGLIHVDLAGPTRPTARDLANVVEDSGFTYKGITIP
jgi:copper chaperone CopZ